MPSKSKWVPFTPDHGTVPRARVFCFHHAGGAASSYFDWSRSSSAGIEYLAVQLPGRSQRLDEPFLTTIAALLEPLQDGLESFFDLPYAFFGHSMGAVVAMEFAAHQFARSQTQPCHVAVSGARAPHLPSGQPPAVDLDDDALLERIVSYGGMPNSLLQCRDFMAMAMPILRNDYQAVDLYRPSWPDTLPCSLSAHWASDDPFTDEASVSAWAVYTKSEFTCHRYPGGHFFHTEARPQIQAVINAALRRAALDA